MFTNSDLKNECSRTFYQRGNDLFRMGYVDSLSMLPHEDLEQLVTVRAKVRGSSRNHYEIKLQIDEEMGILDDYTCTCPAYYSYDSMCKHCIAAALAYIAKRGRLEKCDKSVINEVGYTESMETVPARQALFSGGVFAQAKHLFPSGSAQTKNTY